MEEKLNTVDGGAHDEVVVGAEVSVAADVVVAIVAVTSASFLSSAFGADEKIEENVAGEAAAELPNPLKAVKSPVCGADSFSSLFFVSSFFFSSAFFSSGAFTTGADPNVNPPKLKAGFGSSGLSPPMTNVEGGDLAVPPKMDGTSDLGGVAVTVVVVAGAPKTGFTGVAGSDGTVVASFPNMDPVDEGAPKTGTVAGFGDSVVAVSEVPNLIGPVPNTGVAEADDLGVPNVKPVAEPEPRGTEVPKEGVDAAKGVFVPKEKLLDAGDPPKENPPGTVAPPNLDAKLDAAVGAAASAGALGFGVLQQGQTLTSPPLRV